MENLINENLNDDQKLTTFFSLGKAYDDLKDIKKAFDCFIEQIKFIIN
jgi:hypothetical protein